MPTRPPTSVRPRYTFDPGARTNWHSHAGGQVIIVEQGRLRVQERGRQAASSTRATRLAAAGIVHLHGARPEAPLTQVAISFGMTTWLEKVTDEQYAWHQKRPRHPERQAVGLRRGRRRRRVPRALPS